MAHQLTYKLLHELLLDLGFERGKVTEKMRVWRHSESGCTLVLPDNKALQVPRPADLVGIKAHLDLQGHLDEQAFESFAREGRLPVRPPEQE